MPGGPLRRRSFRLLLGGQSASAIGDGVAPVALAFAVLDLTGSVKDLGFVLAAQYLPLVVFVLLGGVWADRLPRRSVMVGSDLVRAAVQGTSAALLLAGAAHVWQLVVLQATYGTAKAFFGPASTGLVPETVAAEALHSANALIGGGENLAAVLGPALAGVLVSTAGPGWGLAFDGAAFLVSAVTLQAMRLAPVPREPRRSTIAELREGWKSFRSRTWLWVSVASLTLIVTLTFAPLDVLGPAVARDRLGGAWAWAGISTAIGAGAVIGGAVGLRWRPRHPLRWGFLITLAGEPVLLALLAGGGSLAPMVAFGLAGGMASTLFNVFWFTTVHREIPAAELSRVSSWDHLGTYALQPLGLALIGPLAAAFGIPATLYVCAGLVVLLTTAVLAVPSVRNFTGTSGAGPAAPVAELT